MWKHPFLIGQEKNIAFKTKSERNKSDDILITYLYILMAATYTRLD